MTRLRKALVRLFGRDGLVTVSVVVAFLTAWLPIFGWSTATTGAVSAALVTVGGFVAAALVSVDRALPALVGVGQAVIAAVLSFGVALPANWVAAITAALSVVAGLTTRPQVGAKQPPRDRYGSHVPPGWPRPIYPTATIEYFEDDTEAVSDHVDAPPLETDPGSPGRVIDRGEFVTEVLPAVQGEAPAETQHGEHENGAQGRHRKDGWRPHWGQLRPERGV